MPLPRTPVGRSAAAGVLALLAAALPATLASPAQAADSAVRPSHVIHPIAGDGIAAAAINDRGQVVGTTSVAPDNGQFVPAHGFLWQHGRMTDLGPAVQNAYLINNRGQMVGTRDLNAVAHALLLRHGTVTELGNLGVDFTSAHGLNEHTVVVGDRQVVEGGQPHGFRWANGKLTDLGEGSAVAVNNRGQFVVNRNHPSVVEIYG